MSDRVGFQVQGLAEKIRGFKALGIELADLKAAFARIAADGATIAARVAPHRSGRLAGSVRGNRAASKAVVRAGGASVPYAGAINYGWPARGIAPAAFMQTADQQMRPIAVAQLEAEINSQIHQKGL